MKTVFASAAVVVCACLSAQLVANAETDSKNKGTDSTAATPTATQRNSVISSQEEGGIAAVCTFPAVGPDVIVGDITGPANYSATGAFEALSVGTTSCNLGNTWLSWSAGDNQHPVISQNLYRLKTVNGAARFEHVGQSWLKHGFYALSQNLCCDNCSGTNGTHLGVGCSDPYSPTRNGEQSNLGPKWQVNAHTGYFDYPPANPTYGSSVDRRLRVAISDLEPSGGVGAALYFAEAQYVSPDDAYWGNQNNNASYRQISVSGAGSAWNFGTLGATQRQKSAIQAWKAVDPSVTLVDVQADGLFIVGYKVTALGGGMWNYEYAIYNMNSDKSGQSFVVPVSDCVLVQNVGFHDVDYHSGDGGGNISYPNTDWSTSRANGELKWATQTAAQNWNANALRWGTLYNFRFDANAPPAAIEASLGLFKVVTPTSVPVVVQGPQGNQPSCPADVAPAGGNGVVNVDDLLLVIANWGNAGGPGDVSPPCGNGQINVDDLLAIIAAWGPCQ